MKVVVAITAASGAIYARQLLAMLVANREVERIAVIYSANARAVVAHEGEIMPKSEKIEEYENDNLFAAPASGSARWDAMVVIPSSVGTVGRVASGVSQTLIERAADVILPATPSFYSLPQDIESLCQTVTERVTAMLGLECERYEWGK